MSADSPAEFSMSMGPAGNQWCCGKPVGCTILRGMDPEEQRQGISCSYLNHPWKLRNIAGHREAMEQLRAERAARAAEAAAER